MDTEKKSSLRDNELGNEIAHRDSAITNGPQLPILFRFSYQQPDTHNDNRHT